MTDLEQRDREVLDALQREFPIASTPYAIIGQMVEMSEKEVIKRAIRLRHNGSVRAIQIRWNPKALGCTVALAIAAVGEDKIDDAVEAINGHPGVSQNYRRNHTFNLWFTICLPPDSELGLNATLQAIASEAGIDRIHALPASASYRDGELEPDAADLFRPDEHARRRIRALQDELPIQPRPFDAIARKVGDHPEELIDFVREQKELGTISRIGPLVSSGRRFTTSAMGVWKVPDERVEQVARAFSEDEGIPSSTVRKPQEDWPYNLFTIIQGRSVDECERTMKRLGEMSNLSEYQALFPVHEYKQTRMNLFPPELSAWERAHSSGSTTAAS